MSDDPSWMTDLMSQVGRAKRAQEEVDRIVAIDPNFERNGDRVKVFRDEKGEWRWQRSAANGKVVSVSGEGYRDKEYAIDMAEQLNPGRVLRVQGD
jgi:uncharacterized protein YegP (UPF0339 family)